MKKKFRSFEDARTFARTLSIRSGSEWKKLAVSNQLPDDIPHNPAKSCKNKGWISWGDWLGTGNVAFKNINYCSFNEARSFARKLNLKNQEEWNTFCKSGNKPENIPTAPDQKYHDVGWISWGDFLGTGNMHSKNFRILNDARKYVQELKLKNQKEWREYCKSGNKPNGIPNKPEQAYKNKGWISWGDWLGTGRIASQNMQFRTYEKARKFVHALKLKNGHEWRKYIKSGNKPKDIPALPSRTYQKKWINWGDWLGTGTIATQLRVYRSFKEAREFVHSLGINSMEEWQTYCVSGNKPDDIPSSPWAIYKEWKDKINEKEI